MNHRLVPVLALSFLSVSAFVQNSASIDPKAKTILEQTVRAYHDLRSLEQETVYNASGTGLGRLLKSKLLVQKPNKLLLELYERDPNKTNGAVSRFLCDGKSFYTYRETDFSTLQMDNTFTEDKAPRSLAAFKDLTGSMEIAALGGADPFAALLKQARVVKIEEPVVVDGAQNDVVLLDMGNQDRTGELRLFLSQSDHLMRKMVYDSKEIPKPQPKTDPPPTLEPGELPLDPLEPPKPVHFEYENRVTPNPPIAKDAFKWLKPPGAWRALNNADAITNQKRKGAAPYVIATPIDTPKSTDPSDMKPTKTVHASDLIKKAQKRKN